MSLKPGIGSAWYEKFNKEVFPFDRCIVNGREVKPPKFYTLKLKKNNPEMYEEVQVLREEHGKKHAQDNTDERLLVKEEVLKAKIAFKARRSI